MATVCSVTVIKRFTYRGNATEEFSNHYYLTGAIPSSSAAWSTLFDALVVAEKPCYPSSASVVRGYGYSTDDPHDANVWSRDLTVSPDAVVPGTLVTTSGTLGPGDAAVWVRWKTSRNNERGKPIYLRKYFHPAVFLSASGADVILTAQKTNLNALGAKLQDGSFLDARTLRSRTHDETLLSHAASDYLTTRTLKRRGKRPTSGG